MTEWRSSFSASEGQWEVRRVQGIAHQDTADEVWIFSFRGIDEAPEALERHFIKTLIEPNGGDCFVSTVRKTTTEWGASGASWELLMVVASSVVSSAAYDGLKAFARGVHSRKADRGPMLREDAIRAATQAVLLRYRHVERAHLECVGESDEHGEQLWTVELRTQIESFSVEIDNCEGLYATRITRRVRDDPR